MRRKYSFFVCLSLCLFSLMVAVAGAMQPEDVYTQVRVGVSDLSPDGGRLIYTRAVYDSEAGRSVTTCFCRDLDTGRQQVFFEPDDNAWGAVWRPDGRAIAFLQRDDDGTAIRMMSQDGKDHRTICEAGGPTGPLHWSPDGQWLAFIASAAVGQYEGDEHMMVVEEIAYRHLGVGYREGHLDQLHVVEVKTGEVVRILDEALDVRSLAWSADSRRIVFEAKRHEDLGVNLDTNLWVIERDGQGLTRWTSNPGADMMPVWLEDGRVAWRRAESRLDESAPCRIAVADFDGTGEAGLVLHAADFDNRLWMFTPRGDHFLYTGFRRGCIDVLTTDGDRALTDGGHDFWSLHHAGGRVIMGGATQTTPSAIYQLDLSSDGRSATLRTLVDPNADWVAEVGIYEPQFMQVEVDGRDLDCWYILPPDLQPGQSAPTVLSIHGGPEWMYGGYFLPEFHVLPEAGYAVIYANPAGSTGYGFRFQERIVGDWLETPAREVLACLDRAVADGWADPDRLAVMGGSYGGYLACGLTVLTDRFRAAAADRMSCDPASFWGTTDEKWFAEHEFGGRPWDPQARAVYESHNLVLKAGRASTPTLISQGLLDYRCLIDAAETWFSVLKAREVPVRFLRFKEEGHGIRNQRNIVTYLNELTTFFDRHVKGGE